MHHILTKRGLLGGALALTVALGAGAAAQAQDQSQPVKAGDLVISNAWTRATPGGAKVGGGYLTIENKGTTADKLVGGTTAVAGKLEVHQMSMSDGVMKMHPVEGGVAIEQGETVPVTLQFEKAGKVAVSLSVQGIGAAAPGAGGGAMMMMKKDPDHSQHGAGK